MVSDYITHEPARAAAGRRPGGSARRPARAGRRADRALERAFAEHIDTAAATASTPGCSGFVELPAGADALGPDERGGEPAGVLPRRLRLGRGPAPVTDPARAGAAAARPGAEFRGPDAAPARTRPTAATSTRRRSRTRAPRPCCAAATWPTLRPTNPQTMSVNLSSDRVRLALSLLEGIRNGQSLGALLGYRFERGLHDDYGARRGRHVHLSAAQGVPARRRLAGERRRPCPDVPIEAIEARNVLDGRKLIDQHSGDRHQHLSVRARRR